ncbi:uncharacterized protein LOC134209487 [Armigeres subalbatus]|uniref:uncharacterized protein LOC134209487 n=1 Tax=Armigeres subalbatus TaxID=124917 RepID=UPI002ED20EFB
MPRATLETLLNLVTHIPDLLDSCLSWSTARVIRLFRKSSSDNKARFLLKAKQQFQVHEVIIEQWNSERISRKTVLSSIPAFMYYMSPAIRGRFLENSSNFGRIPGEIQEELRVDSFRNFGGTASKDFGVLLEFLVNYSRNAGRFPKIPLGIP